MEKLTKRQLTRELPRLEEKYIYDVVCKLSDTRERTKVIVAINEIEAARHVREQFCYYVDYIVSVTRREGTVQA
jgi:hypothetical protein